MSASVLFNRRLGKNEITQLLELIDSTRDEVDFCHDEVFKFFQLDESIAFISSINDEVIGGTIVYRDRTRLGMALAAIIMNEKFRNSETYAVIKSSLPFFRTAAIRDVDAIVTKNSEQVDIGFPISFCQPFWTLPILERIGFTYENTLFNCSLNIASEDSAKFKEIKWDFEPNIEGAKSLIWDEGKAMGLMNSITWMSMDFAVHSKRVHTLSDHKSTKLVTSVYSHKGIAIFGLLAAREELWNSRTSSSILTSVIMETKAEDIRFPLIGEGQIEMLETIAEEIGGSLKKKSMILMRRRL